VKAGPKTGLREGDFMDNSITTMSLIFVENHSYES
jgi:hypothetical protein